MAGADHGGPVSMTTARGPQFYAGCWETAAGPGRGAPEEGVGARDTQIVAGMPYPGTDGRRNRPTGSPEQDSQI